VTVKSAMVTVVVLESQEGGIPELALHLISSALSRIVHTVLLACLAFVNSYACELLIAGFH
jgi:hypothetical protein